jgi:manganese-dependent inorganic pyrophosphatase
VNVKDLVSVSPYRTACVIDEKNRLLGMISRNTFLQEVSKSVILLDHNELTQAVDGIENAEILEIIDHHRIGAITTLKPITFINEPVGSTSTIITEKFREAGITPKESTAGLLLSGILSDTLVLRLSTTTGADHAAVDYLAGILGIDPIEYGTDLIRKGMDLEGTPIDEMLIQDMKEYHLFGQDVTISQVMVPTFDFSAEHAPAILAELRRVRGSTGIAVALFTSVFENASEVFTIADSPVLEKLGLADQPTRMDGVMSRKKDFLPRLGRMLKNI